MPRALLLFGLLLGMGSDVHAETAPDFQLRSIENQPIKLSDYRGKVVLLDFWATWCGPCKVAMPHLQKLYTELEDQGFVVLSISIDEARTASRVKPYIKSKRYTFPVVLDKETEAITLYNPQKTLPYVVLIDTEGQIVWRHAGYVPGDEKEVEKQVRALLEDAK